MRDEAAKVIVEAMTPRNESERERGVDLDVAALRVMLSNAPEAIRQEALKRLADKNVAVTVSRVAGQRR